ncbi:hypothetical protein GCM10010121_061600 [Streptomyces brasiliensis]|uniref:Uncharacterized protein n=1 Tax=Streptomyces brasiliensis TaxID=1954 RepID=A0A917NZ07_9ACTN|nr:hypothetical protein GCM10010121_061600 [Streptomyces brasiliensis]
MPLRGRNESSTLPGPCHELDRQDVGDVPPGIAGWATAFLSSSADFDLFEQKFWAFERNFRVTDSIFGGFAAIRSAQELGPSQSLTSDPGGH